MVLRAFGRPLPAMIRPPTTGLRRPLPAMNRPPFLVPMLTLGPAPQAHKASCVSGVVQSRHRGMRQLSFHLNAGGQHCARRPGGRGRAGRVERPRGVANSGRFSPTVRRRRRPMPPRLSRHCFEPMPRLRRRRGGPDFFRMHFGPFSAANFCGCISTVLCTPLNITHAAPPFLSPGCCG